MSLPTSVRSAYPFHVNKTLTEIIVKNIESKYTRQLFLGVLVTLVLGAGAFAAKAQNAGVFEIDVPFDFVVNGRTYAAARYQIGRLNQASPDTLVLNSSNGKTLLILNTQRLNSGPSERFSKLTFSRYGETNFLESIRSSGSSYESRIPAIRADRRRRSIAQGSHVVSITTR